MDTVLSLLLIACMACMATSDFANNTLVASNVSSNFTTQLQQEFDACRLNDSQAAALGRPDVVGKVRICISPWTPLVFCTPDKDQSTYTGYTVEVFKALAQRVPWLSDFGSWYFDCMDWTPMIEDLASESGSCLMAPSGLSPGDVTGKNVEISWITDKQGLRILTIPHHKDANLWAPLTVFSVPVWALIFGTGVFVGVILWLFDTRARSLLKIPVNSQNHTLQKALRKQSEVIIARLLSAQIPRLHQNHQQKQPGQQDNSSVVDSKHSKLAGTIPSDTATGVCKDLDCQIHLSLDSDSSDIFSSESESSAVIDDDDASCRAVRTAAGIDTLDADGVEHHHHHQQQQQKQQQKQQQQIGKDPAAADSGSRLGQRQRRNWKHTGTTHLLRWLGVKPGKEKKALKLLSSNVVRSLLRLPDMREPPNVKTLPAQIVLFVYGLLLLILIAIYTANSAAQLTTKMNSNIRSVQDMKGLPVSTWAGYATKLMQLGVPAISLPWESNKDEEAMLDIVRTGQAKALVIDASFADYTAAQNCEFAVVGDEFAIVDVGVGYGVHMVEDLKQDLNRYITALIEGGVLERLYDVNVKQTDSRCNQQQISQGSFVSQVTIQQIGGLWVVLALSVGLGACLLLVYWVRQQIQRRHSMACLRRA